MEFGSLMVTAPAQQRHRTSMGLHVEASLFHFVLLLACALFGLSQCEPCLINSMEKLAANDACNPCGDDHDLGFQDGGIADRDLEYPSGTSMPPISIEGICPNPHSLCSLSTLACSLSNEASSSRPGYPLSFGSAQDSRGSNGSWQLDIGMFRLFNGQTVNCFLNVRDSIAKSVSKQPQGSSQGYLSSSRCSSHAVKSRSFRVNKNSEKTKSGPLDSYPSQHVEVHPPVLDWGEKHLYSLSVAFLTVANTCNDSILNVHEPVSTDSQFFPCNFSEVSLGPGEVASLCFVFIPRSLGLSSAQLILQTSSGGFLVQVKGSAVKSPYKIGSFVSLCVPSRGRLSKNLSIFNPYNETLLVKEVSAWMSVSQGNFSHQSEATCSLENSQDPGKRSLVNVFEDWQIVGGEGDNPLMVMRPNGNWEVGASHTETIMEVDFFYRPEGRIFGAFCVHLLRSSQDASDTVMVPFEVDLDTNLAKSGSTKAGSIAFMALVPSDAPNAAVVVAISVRNESPYMLRILEISEVAAANIFQIKYIKDVLLFPDTATPVATVTCARVLAGLFDSLPETSNIKKSCKLIVLTNDSCSPPIELSCEDVIDTCLRHQKHISVGYDSLSGKAESGNQRRGSLGSSTQLSSSIKACGTAEADEFILGSWKSQGSASGMSVLDNDEVMFPRVQVGGHFSRWITVKNPTEKPVVMQLILSSGEIIDECIGDDGFVQLPSAGSLVHGKSVTATRNGFSVADSAITEAYVHPYGKASLGPILFHPLRQCGWRSSALIRNNLSGVESLSLTGFGGSFDLVLYEGSEVIQSIEFDLNLPPSVNISPPKTAFCKEEIANACLLSLSKELHAKNMGNMPLVVESIAVSGMQCGLDGFTVQTCEGFSLQPGESKKLLVSYQTVFSLATIQRDLQLALHSGIVVIPMKASFPSYMFNLCWKSVLWMRWKKILAVILLAALFIFLIISCIFPQVIDFGYQEYFYKSDKGIVVTVQGTGKTSQMHRGQRSTKFSRSTDMDVLFRSFGKDKTLKKASAGKYTENQDGSHEHGFIVQNVTPIQENQKQYLLHTEQDGPAPSLLSKSTAAENPDALGASQPCSLTVRIGKERGRRRRKRKGVNASLNMFDVSSSHSGNSTPSSPLSPVMSVMPNFTHSPSPDIDHIEARSPFTRSAESKATLPELKASVKQHQDDGSSSSQELISASRRTRGEPVLSSSATFPCAGKVSPNVLYTSSLASKSTIAPDARAPGPKLYNQKAVNVEEKVGDEYRYDIWGDHLSGLNLSGSSKHVATMKTAVTKSDSNSFFVRGPQVLMTRSQPNYVSCFRPEG